VSLLQQLPFDEWIDNVALAALSSRETLEASYEIAKLAIERGVPGDFVECGVFGGAQCAAMARAIMDDRLDPDGAMDGARRVHLFDSFEGIPAAGPHDANWPHPPGTSACSLEACKAHMREWGIPDELLVWHKGAFKLTVPAVGLRAVSKDGMGRPVIGAIAVLRLDGDLYESTRVCLEHLYPLLSPGGWCIVDDFGLPGCRKAVDEYMESIDAAGRPVYWQKGKA
jgi:O-methyltransferase